MNSQFSNIDGLSGCSARNHIYKEVEPELQGVFTQNPAQKIWGVFDSMGLDWELIKTIHLHDKIVWQFKIIFNTHQDETCTIFGEVTMEKLNNDRMKILFNFNK